MTFEVKPCLLKDLDTILAMEDEAIASMERKDMLRHNGREMLSSCLQPPHLTLGAFSENETLAAIAVLYVPKTRTGDDLSQYLTKNKPQHAANFKLCIVRPQYRGNHLMRHLGEAIIREAKARGFDGLCSTVSPYNPASYRSLEALGFSLDSTFEHYTGNLLRRLYYLPL